MALKTILVLFQGVASLASAAIIAKTGNQHDGSGLLLLEPNTTLLPAIPGVHTSSGNASLSVRYTCIPQPGAKSNPASCQNAIDKIPRTTYAISLGRRGTGDCDIRTPYVYISDDGACLVFLGIDRGAGRDLSTFGQLSSGANYMQRECIERYRATAIIRELGHYQTIAIHISRAFPAVECNDNPAPPYTSCRSVLDTMPIDQVDRSFGPGGQHALPLSIRSSDGQCEFQITTAGQTASTTRWDQIFTVIAQIDEMCIKNGKSGSAYRIGSASQLMVRSVPRQALAAS